MSSTSGESPRVTRGRRTCRQYRCLHCGKVFKRNEHRVRHERIHTREKPYRCHYCHKSYARKDLVTRHERTLHAESVVDEIRALGDAVENTQTPSIGTSPSEATGGDGECGGQHTTVVQGRPTPEDDLPDRTTAHLALSPPPSLMSGMVLELDQAPKEGDLRRGSKAEMPPPSGGQPPAAFGTCEPRLVSQQTLLAGFWNNLDTLDTGALSALGPNVSHQSQPPLVSDLDLSLAGQPLPDLAFLNEAELAGLEALFPLNIELPPRSQDPPSQDQDHVGSRRESSDRPVCQTAENAIRPRNYLPLLSGDNPPPTPKLLVDQVSYDSICQDLGRRLAVDNAGLLIPPRNAFQCFISSYIGCFHHHFPLIHLQSLKLSETPSPLILAMCSIGALHRLDRRRARYLYDLTERATKLTRVSPTNGLGREEEESCPLWIVQTRLLLTFYASLNGDMDLTVSAMEGHGFHSLIYRTARSTLQWESPDINDLTWSSWVRRESWKRLLGGIYISSTVMMIVYGISPGFNATDDIEFETFHDERLWNAETASEWRELLPSQAGQDTQIRTVKEVMQDIILEEKRESGPSSYRISPFSMLVVMHAVVVHMWQRLQVLQATAPLRSAPDPAGGPLRSSLITAALQSLSRCRELLRLNKDQSCRRDPDDSMERSMIFTCQAMLRIAYTNLLRTGVNFNRLSLTSTDPTLVETAVSAFATTKLVRSPQLITAVAESFEGVKIPVKLGHRLVRKTAAFRWSIEHAVAAWEGALFVTKWVHSVEIDQLNNHRPSPEERDLLAYMKGVLDEGEFYPGGSHSIAAELARAWSVALEDVWVWKITFRMGQVLSRLAAAYERVNEASSSS